MNLTEMTRHGLAGQSATREEALQVLDSSNDELLSVIAAAGKIRRHFFGNRVRLNYLVNLKSGMCPEDCSYCSQRLGSQAEIMKYSWADPRAVHAAVEAGIGGGARRVCLVASGHGPSDREVNRVNRMVREIKDQHPEVEVCVCLGFVDDEKAASIKQAGADAYNHNANTARSHYGEICSTHSYDDRMNTLEALRRAGLSPCSGIIAGMGELHLEIIVDRLLREFKVEANVGAPQVAYKESITKPVDIDSKYAKQSGGRGQYGHCKVKFEPMDVNGEETYKFESTVVGGAIPKEYIPAVGEGIEEAMKSGILGGFPVVGVYANVYDGSYHEVDSSEMAFHIAGSLAFKDAMKQGAPVLLEPIMKVEVTMPEEYMGDIIGDLNSRRGRIEGMDDLGGGKIVRAYVPLSEMFGYSTDLRSRTQGRGNYSMFFEKYEPVPKSVQEKVLSNKNA